MCNFVVGNIFVNKAKMSFRSKFRSIGLLPDTTMRVAHTKVSDGLEHILQLRVVGKPSRAMDVTLGF